MLSILELRWINMPSISNLLSPFSQKFRKYHLVAITNAQRRSGSGTMNTLRFAILKSHRSIIRGRPGRWIFMFALTQLFGSFACHKSFCSSFSFLFCGSTLLWNCSLPSVAPYPCITPLYIIVDAQPLGAICLFLLSPEPSFPFSLDPARFHQYCLS